MLLKNDSGTNWHNVKEDGSIKRAFNSKHFRVKRILMWCTYYMPIKLNVNLNIRHHACPTTTLYGYNLTDKLSTRMHAIIMGSIWTVLETSPEQRGRRRRRWQPQLRELTHTNTWTQSFGAANNRTCCVFCLLDIYRKQAESGHRPRRARHGRAPPRTAPSHRSEHAVELGLLDLFPREQSARQNTYDVPTTGLFSTENKDQITN
jgi:hypothetical protein